MEKQEIIELTNRVYKLTLLFPKKEPLRYKIREIVQELLANLITLETINNPDSGMILISEAMNQRKLFFVAEKDLEILDSYLEVAKWQNWVSYFDVLEIQQKYANIRGNLEVQISRFYNKEEAAVPGQKELLGGKDSNNPAVSEKDEDGAKEKPAIPFDSLILKSKESDQGLRHNKILDILNKVETIQVGEINKFFPGVSKRTLRRDFQKLMSKNFIERMGDKNDTFYKLKDKNIIQEA